MDPDFVESVDLWLQARLEQVHTCIPGCVQSYNADARTATVKPSVAQRSLHGDLLAIPPINDVPVVWPSCGQFTLSGTLREGDGVLLLFTESGIGNWLQSTQDTEAEDQTRFSLQDAICVPGLWQPSRVPRHKRRKAQWGLMSERAEIGATEAGKISLANQVSDLRTELEAVYARLEALNTYIQASATTLNDAAVGPLAVLQPGFASMDAGTTLELTTALPASKLGLKGLLA